MMQDDPMRILPATRPAQARRIVSLAERIWREYFPRVITPAQIEYMLARFLSYETIRTQMREGYRYYLFEQAAGDVGFMAVTAAEGALHISKLYLLPEARGRGLAREAMQFLETLCREEHLDRLWLRVNIHNDLAIAVYRHLGFQVRESLVEDIGGGFVMDDYVMEKGPLP